MQKLWRSSGPSLRRRTPAHRNALLCKLAITRLQEEGQQIADLFSSTILESEKAANSPVYCPLLDPVSLLWSERLSPNTASDNPESVSSDVLKRELSDGGCQDDGDASGA